MTRDIFNSFSIIMNVNERQEGQSSTHQHDSEETQECTAKILICLQVCVQEPLTTFKPYDPTTTMPPFKDVACHLDLCKIIHCISKRIDVSGKVDDWILIFGIIIQEKSKRAIITSYIHKLGGEGGGGGGG